MSLVTEEIKAKAEMVYGPRICKERVKGLLVEIGMPNGILAVDNIEECGHVKETRFVWFKRNAKKEYAFVSTGKVASYATEVTGYVEKNKIKKLTGVKSKELGVWFPINEVYVKDPEKVTFKAPAGLFKTYPFSTFEIEEKAYEEAEAAKEAMKVGEGKMGVLIT